MAKINIDSRFCKGCKLCVVVCPKKNIKADSNLNKRSVFPATIINSEECTGCGLCYVMCPDACITIEDK